MVQHFSSKNISSSIHDHGLLELLKQAQMSEAKLHLAFMFSSPLVRVDARDDRITHSVDAIDHAKEFAGVLEGLQEACRMINYRKVPATLDKITAALTEGPIALHFSGHGIRGATSSTACCKDNPLGRPAKQKP